MKEECFESSGHECTTETSEQCEDVQRKVCHDQPSEQCSTEYSEVCMVTEEEVCHNEHVEECRTEHQCWVEEVEECNEVGVPSPKLNKAKQRSQTVCKLVPVKQCKDK